MAECRDFFDESTSGARRSSSSGDKPCISTPPESMEEGGADCLELTLGLGPSVGGFQTSCPLQVRPASVYTCLPKQSSGNFASSPPFAPTSDASQTAFSHVDASKGFQNFRGRAEVTALAKQHSGNFAIAGTQTHPSFGGQSDTGLAVKPLFSAGDSEFPSRDQIWRALQKNGTVSRQDVQYATEASSMWGRRSASMHVMVPHKDLGDAENGQIRRSCSSGVFPHTVSRQVSSIESSLEKSPQQNMMYSQDHDQEAFEDLRKRKEMQAQRRQEARKRRKILIEEKQHKKSKQSSSLQRLGSRQSISPNDKLSLAGTPISEDGVTQESHCASADAVKQEGQGKVRKSMMMIQNLHTEETKQETHSLCVKDDKVDMLVSSIDEVEGPSHFLHSKGGMSMHGYNTMCGVPIKDGAVNGGLSHEHNSGSHSSMMTNEFEQSTSVGNCVVGSKLLTTGNEHNHGSSLNSHGGMVTTVHAGPRMNEDEGGKSSETECVESTSILNNARLLQCTSERGGLGLMVSSALSTAPATSGSLSYPPFRFLASPYPYTVAPATPTATPLQQGFPFPFLMQYRSHCDNDLSSLHGTCSVVTGTTLGKSLPGALILKASSGCKDCESFEGKGGCSEKPAFSPLSRTASNLKHVKEEPQCLGVQLESQVTFPVSQLSSISSVASDACNTKNSTLERQQSMPVEGRLLSQNSNAQDLSTLSSKQERPTLAQRGVDVQHETATSRMGTKAEVKQVERVKQEEGNVESQLGSELSGVAYVQSGSVERQKSGSFPDLPWVTTTGKGPNGKTINGVMYIVNRQHVRLVCSCHGKHMSPVEFVEHSGSTDLSNPEKSIVVCPFPSLNHQLAAAPV